jgi:protein-tyrosine phosphatase
MPSDNMKILMVCLGNICRSPLAEGIMKHKIVQNGLDWQVDSAGTGNYHVGELPDHRSVAVARKYGIDITDQRARQFQKKDFEIFDHILVMDASNYQNVLKLGSSEKDQHKVRLIMEFQADAELREVPDPYWDNEGFEKVFKMLDGACDAFLEKNKFIF